MNAIDRYQYRLFMQRELCSGPCGNAARRDPNRELLAGLIAGRVAGLGCLPAHLGLGDESFATMMDQYFPTSRPKLAHGSQEALPEWDELMSLLLDYRAGLRPSEEWMARITVAACVGRDHLWQDMGLGNRNELTRLIQLNFPSLAAANVGDMKWKKFFYKQFCARDGIYVCPAPSCGECADRVKCFAPEE